MATLWLFSAHVDDRLSGPRVARVFAATDAVDLTVLSGLSCLFWEKTSGAGSFTGSNYTVSEERAMGFVHLVPDMAQIDPVSEDNTPYAFIIDACKKFSLSRKSYFS